MHASFLRSRLAQVLVAILVFVSLMGVDAHRGAYACYNWGVGQRVALRRGGEIRQGPGLGYKAHTVVPDDNWQVDVIGGPRTADGQQWWDTSRKNLDGGGSGWVSKSQAGHDICGGQPNPVPQPQPGLASPEMAGGISLSSNQVTPGSIVEGSYTVRNNGGQDWRPQRIGLKVEGPTYLDFGWAEGIGVSPGQDYAFHGRIPSAPDTSGNYTVSGTWQDDTGNWHSLGGQTSFVIGQTAQPNSQPQPQPPPPAATCNPGTDGIVLYQHADYQGSCMTVTSDVEDFASTGLNDQTSSFRFVGRYAQGWSVILFEHAQYSGNQLRVGGDVRDLASSGFNDILSSIQLVAPSAQPIPQPVPAPIQPPLVICNPESGCVYLQNGDHASVKAEPIGNADNTCGHGGNYLVTYKIGDKSEWANVDSSKIRVWVPSRVSRLLVLIGSTEVQVVGYTRGQPEIKLCLGTKYSKSVVEKSWVWLVP